MSRNGFTKNPAGRYPKTIDIIPKVSAYGIWVLTWSMWLTLQDIEAIIVVSETGEQ